MYDWIAHLLDRLARPPVSVGGAHQHAEADRALQRLEAVEARQQQIELRMRLLERASDPRRERKGDA